MMTKAEKARLDAAERKAALLDQCARALVDFLRDDLEQIARDAAEEVADDLQISR